MVLREDTENSMDGTSKQKVLKKKGNRKNTFTQNPEKTVEIVTRKVALENLTLTGYIREKRDLGGWGN